MVDRIHFNSYWFSLTWEVIMSGRKRLQKDKQIRKYKNKKSERIKNKKEIKNETRS